MNQQHGMTECQHLLLVEDNPDDEAMTLRSLNKSQLGNRVDVVRDGKAALDYFFDAEGGLCRDPKQFPAMVLLDLKLPKVDGLQVLKALRAHDATAMLPVVVFTSSDLDRDIVESYKLGANSFVSKPVNINDFFAAVQELGLYWMVLNRPPYGDAR